MSNEQPKQQNPFELTPHNGILVPRVLLSAERAGDLEQYTKGWMDQKKYSDQITPRAVEGNTKTEIQSADDWYKTGAVKCWTSMNEPNGDGHANTQQELDEVMKKMRTNPDLIPRGAWPADGDNIDQPN